MAGFTRTALYALTAAQTVGGAVWAMRQGKAARAEGDFAARQQSINAALAAMQANDALARGEEDVSRLKGETKQLQGAQRTAIAAAGIDASVGSAAEILRDTNYLGELDALTIRNNARREAWGFQVDEMNARRTGAMAKQAGKNAEKGAMWQAGSTLLTGAAQMYGMRRQRR